MFRQFFNFRETQSLKMGLKIFPLNKEKSVKKNVNAIWCQLCKKFKRKYFNTKILTVSTSDLWKNWCLDIPISIFKCTTIHFQKWTCITLWYYSYNLKNYLQLKITKTEMGKRGEKKDYKNSRSTMYKKKKIYLLTAAVLYSAEYTFSPEVSKS